MKKAVVSLLIVLALAGCTLAAPYDIAGTLRVVNIDSLAPGSWSVIDVTVDDIFTFQVLSANMGTNQVEIILAEGDHHFIATQTFNPPDPLAPPISWDKTVTIIKGKTTTEAF